MIKVTADGIDKKKPWAERLFRTTHRCEKCNESGLIEIMITANTGQKLIFTFDGKCGNKKCKKKFRMPIVHDFR